ncbi:MAG: hypothetical protein CME71_01975 [Halobacteriovorax sp.]|nr:hypothetical protein [Halobacteriovorax sp.]
MKKLTIALFTALTSLSSFAVEVYFPSERIDSFACTISKSIKEAYPDKSRRQLRKGILKLLREEIDPWVDAYPIPAGISFPKYLERITGLPGFPMDRSEYYLQNAFILYGNPKLELKVPSENYFASYIHLARKRHVAYLNGEEPRFQLRDEADLFEQITNHLPNVADYAFPYQDEQGRAIQQEGDLKHPYQLAIGKPTHKKYDEFVYESQRYNHFVSPLFVWLLEQDDYSITPEKLFEKALEIYGDPIVALGVIPWIFSGDALTVSRGTSSVVSYKMERIVEGNDIPGYQYHLWGYITQGMIGNRIRVGALALIYEKLYQKDIPDWKVDVLALKIGKNIRSNIKRPERCN